ncbi:hypothetical protein [uncultured Pontibacter sp.]|uniref:hypothetical protein n=1 Tax=uncultured Pontibacter sp. TaxID=453356 RepID=UPI00262EDFA6|nr:hypothetical protein [uncultured Pontibacter sp.]
MDDFKIILYILAAVAYFLFSQWRKAFNSSDAREDEAPAKPQQRRVQPQQPARPVTSFEDILRELQPKMEKGRAEVENARERAREVIPPVMATVESAPKYRNYDDMAPKALSWEKPAEAIQAQRRSDARKQPIFKGNTESLNTKPSRYAAMLQNPATVRDAVILSEIFNRKYT